MEHIPSHQPWYGRAPDASQVPMPPKAFLAGTKAANGGQRRVLGEINPNQQANKPHNQGVKKGLKSKQSSDENIFAPAKNAFVPSAVTVSAGTAGAPFRIHVDAPKVEDRIPSSMDEPEAMSEAPESVYSLINRVKTSSALNESSAMEDSPMDTTNNTSTASACSVDAEEETSKERTEEEYLDSLEYVPQICKHYQEKEKKFMAKHNYMDKQPDINFGMREILVDWLVEVSEEYKMTQESLYLTVNFVDRFLSFMSVQRPKLQLVGTACMFIASKYEEIYPPDLSEFVYITDDTYTKKQVLRMEHLVLKVLAFELSAPTPLFFVNMFAKVSGSEAKVFSLAQYLSELTLMDARRFLRYRPSVIAASAVALARHNLDCEAWPATLVRLTSYTQETFKDCLVEMHEMFVGANDLPQAAIREKYAKAKHNSVSLLTPISIFS